MNGCSSDTFPIVPYEGTWRSHRSYTVHLSNVTVLDNCKSYFWMCPSPAPLPQTHSYTMAPIKNPEDHGLWSTPTKIICTFSPHPRYSQSKGSLVVVWIAVVLKLETLKINHHHTSDTTRNIRVQQSPQMPTTHILLCSLIWVFFGILRQLHI